MKKSQRRKQVQTSQDQGHTLFNRSCPLKICLSVSKGKSPWIMNLANSDKPGPKTITTPNQSYTEIIPTHDPAGKCDLCFLGTDKVGELWDNNNYFSLFLALPVSFSQ